MYHMHHKIPYNFSSINLSFLNILVCNHMFLYYTYILPLHIPYVLHIFFHICLIIEIFYFLFAQMHKPNAIWPSTPYIFFHTVISTPYMLFIHSYVCVLYIHISIAHHKNYLFLFAQMHKPNAIWPSTPYIFFHTVISTSYCNIQIYFILSFLMFVL